MQTSKTPEVELEDEVTKRHLKFLIFLVELAEKDPDWNKNLKEKAEAFGRLES